MAKKQTTKPGDSIPKVKYSNMKMMNQMRSQSNGVRQRDMPAPTAQDSAVYRQGFEFGLKNWQNPPKKSMQGESHMYRGGRWEGQNAGKAANYKPKQAKSKAQSLYDRFFK
jgi:hypothetical protein